MDTKQTYTYGDEVGKVSLQLYTLLQSNSPEKAATGIALPAPDAVTSSPSANTGRERENRNSALSRINIIFFGFIKKSPPWTICQGGDFYAKRRLPDASLIIL